MSIRVKLPLILQEFGHGVETCEVIGHTIRECIGDLEVKFPTLQDHLLDSKGSYYVSCDIKYFPLSLTEQGNELTSNIIERIIFVNKDTHPYSNFLFKRQCF